MPYQNVNTLRWGQVRFFSLPSAMIVDNRLKITSAAVNVLVFLYQQAHGQQQARKRSRYSDTPVKINVSHRVLQAKTGLSAPTIQNALADLEENCFIERRQGRRKNGAQYGANQYVLLNPEKGDPLKGFHGSRLIFGNGAQSYFTMPTCFVTENEKPWSLAKLSSSAVAVYTCLLWRANFTKASEFSIENSLLQELTGIKSADTLRRAKDELELAGLGQIRGTRKLGIIINDPHTREKPRLRDADAANPSNYFEIDEKGRRRPFDSNSTYSNAAYVQKLIRALLPDAEIVTHSSTQLAIKCPWHADSNPSLIFTWSIGQYFCFGCKSAGKDKSEYSGSLLWFVRRFKNCTIAEARAFMAEIAGAQFSKTEDVSAEEEAARADEVYEWQDENYWVSNRKVRFGYGAGKKMRWQHLNDKGKWAWGRDDKTLPPLYRFPYVKSARVVAILEGERDVETFRSLELKDTDGRPLAATTTGEADSWNSIVARRHLVGKRVIVLPDNGTAGQRYRVAIEESLNRFQIPYRVVSFSDPSVNDLTDWVKAEHGAADLVRLINDAQVMGADDISEPWVSEWQPEPLYEGSFAAASL